jgi:5-methyltetrahydrofolate--homocysteine methyltransferase
MSLEKVKKLLVELDEDAIGEAVEEALGSHDPRDVLKALCDGMLEVGKLYEEHEYYLPDLVLAGSTMDVGMAVLKPKLAAGETIYSGRVVACTVKGDLHDIGKNIVVTMLTAAGYEVIDLGKNVENEAVAAAVKEHKPDILALSALLTMTVVEIESIVKMLKADGTRDSVVIICGGAPLNQELAEKLGADWSCDDAVAGIELCNSIMAKRVAA